jgi:HSP20 family molecular chaperone IbpA
MFNPDWMEQLSKLQQKAAELTQNQNSTEVVNDLVSNVLKQWGLPNMGDLDSNMSLWQNNNQKAAKNNSDVHITENSTQFVIRAIIPGIKEPNDFNVKLRGLSLSIHCILASENNNFHRQVQLPAEVTVQGATAVYQNEVLTITLPKLLVDCSETIPVTFL